MSRNKIKFGWLLTAISLVALFSLLPTRSAHALGLSDFISVGNIGAGAVGYLAYAIVYFMSTIAGFFIVIFTYLIGVILYLSNNIVNTTSVQNGFGVTLAVANLGFVLAIIIIAVATILNRQSYGIKKALWRLVVAAIMVNFSLVIGGAFINFANVLTNTFLSALPGVGPGSTNGPFVFAQELAGAFSPQRMLLYSSGGNGSVSNPAITGANAGSTLASILTPLVSAFSAAVFLVAILVVLAVFLLQLLIRYVILAVLLIIAPFAWLMWIFENTRGNFSKWWKEFFRWTFFAPIVVFFLWLAIATAQAMNVANNCAPQYAGGPYSGDLCFLNGTQYIAQGNGILAGLSSTFSSFVGAFAGSLLQGVIIIGLAVGGMMVAQKLSITGSKAAVEVVQDRAKKMGSWTAKRTGYYAARTGQGALNLASRAIQPRARKMQGTGPYVPLTTANRIRGKAAQTLNNAATAVANVASSKTLKTKGIAASIWGGTKSTSNGILKGFGIKKGKQVDAWECQNCGHILQSTKKPIAICPNCHATAGVANWTKV